MTQGRRRRVTDLKILRCYCRMRSTSTGEWGNWDKTEWEEVRNYEIKEDPSSISRMGRPISKKPSILIDG